MTGLSLSSSCDEEDMHEPNKDAKNDFRFFLGAAAGVLDVAPAVVEEDGTGTFEVVGSSAAALRGGVGFELESAVKGAVARPCFVSSVPATVVTPDSSVWCWLSGIETCTGAGALGCVVVGEVEAAAFGFACPGARFAPGFWPCRGRTGRAGARAGCPEGETCVTIDAKAWLHRGRDNNQTVSLSKMPRFTLDPEQGKGSERARCQNVNEWEGSIVCASRATVPLLAFGHFLPHPIGNSDRRGSKVQV